MSGVYITRQRQTNLAQQHIIGTPLILPLYNEDMPNESHLAERVTKIVLIFPFRLTSD